MPHQSAVALFNSLSNENVVISFKNIYPQIFNLPCDVIKHILANANYKVVKKLYFTCQYFPAKYRLYLFDTFEGDELVFNNLRMRIQTNFLHLFKDRVWLGHHITWSIDAYISWLTTKVEKCTIKTFNGCSAFKMSWNDFTVLAEARTIEELNIYCFRDTDGQKVSLEDICDYTPNLNYFVSWETRVTPNSFKKICKSLISKNMERFDMKHVHGLFNAEDYLKFMKIRPNAWYVVRFSFAFSEDQRSEFITAIESEIQTWPQKPSFFGY